MKKNALIGSALLLSQLGCDLNDSNPKEREIPSNREIITLNDRAFDEVASILASMRMCAQQFKNIGVQSSEDISVFKINCDGEVAAKSLIYSLTGSGSEESNRFRASENRIFNDQHLNHSWHRTLTTSDNSIEVRENEKQDNQNFSSSIKIEIENDKTCKITVNDTEEIITTELQQELCSKNIKRITAWLHVIFNDIMETLGNN